MTKYITGWNGWNRGYYCKCGNAKPYANKILDGYNRRHKMKCRRCGVAVIIHNWKVVEWL